MTLLVSNNIVDGLVEIDVFATVLQKNFQLSDLALLLRDSTTLSFRLLCRSNHSMLFLGHLESHTDVSIAIAEARLFLLRYNAFAADVAFLAAAVTRWCAALWAVSLIEALSRAAGSIGRQRCQETRWRRS